MTRLLSAAALACVFALPDGAAAQTYPTRPVTMVISFAAGSSIDVVGRIIAPRLSELLGQQVVVENVTGAAGIIGNSRVAKATPDGYQFVLGATGGFAQNQTLYKNLPYNAATDFAPVALLAETPPVLVARKDLPADTLKDFITYTKANQAKMQYGSSGGGTSTHLACVLLNAVIGVDVTHIPYRGGGPAMQDLIAGRIDYQCPLSAVTIPQIESKTVKAIAMLTKERSKILADVPTAHEQGLTDFDAGSWFAFFLPKSTPAPIVQRLNAATVATLDTPLVQQRLFENGATVVAPERRTPDYLQKFVESEIAKWAAAIKAAGVQVE
jgi:tripartite-type tricarboxylate transporter receptor subunit TctC